MGRIEQKEFDQNFFLEKTWKKFVARENIEFLLIGKEQFPYQKKIIFSALRGWLLTGGKKVATKYCAAKTILFIISLAEKSAVRFKENPQTEEQRNRSTPEYIATTLKKFMPFYENCYFPIGGIAKLKKIILEYKTQKKIDNCFYEIDHYIEIMRIFNFHADFLYDKEDYNKASINKAAPLISKSKDWQPEAAPPTSERAAKKWSKYRHRMALLYGAFATKIDGEISLLTIIKTRNDSYAKCKPFLREWISKSRYTVEHIITKTSHNNSEEDEGKKSRNNLISIKPKSFSSRSYYSPQRAETIKKAFLKKKSGASKKINI